MHYRTCCRWDYHRIPHTGFYSAWGYIYPNLGVAHPWVHADNLGQQLGMLPIFDGGEVCPQPNIHPS